MWYIPDYIDPASVDQSWQPPLNEPPFVYNFLSQHLATDSKVLAVGVSGVTYTVPGATHNRVVSEMTVRAIPLMNRWTVPDHIDVGSIDFTWHPNAFDPPFIYHFASAHQKSSGLVYTVPGATDIKFINPFTVTTLAQMDKWTVPDNADVSEFDFAWHPDSLDPDYAYYFPTQHQRQGGPIYNIEGSAGIKFTQSQKIRTDATQIFYMDFLNPESTKQLEELKIKWPDIKSTRYVDNHLNVLRRVVTQADTEFIWVISSIADYSEFDFTWHPEAFQNEMIHVFPADNQVRGDTFYINVRSFRSQMVDLDILDWFNVICYHKDMAVPRYRPETVYYEGDDLITVIKNHQFKTPYVGFSNLPNVYVENDQCLWSAKDRKVDWYSFSKGVTMAPREIKLHLETQIYDYPYLEESNSLKNLYVDEPLDIVYISNGEPDAEHWYNHLCNIMAQEQGKTPYLKYKNEIKRVQNVNGRTAAYQTAARASNTPWFFAVFAKLEVAHDFDWDWEPDMWQGPKHYIFNSRNPVNGLEYGHMGMIAYNKNLVLANDGTGLDFTLNQPHESVPVLSGTAHYNQDAWTTWRTAFREVAKLKYFNKVSPSVETDYRLKIWCNNAQGSHAEWSLKGAADAVEYYNSIDGDYHELMKTYEWDWLRKHFDNKY
jgi:hypothetical protein